MTLAISKHIRKIAFAITLGLSPALMLGEEPTGGFADRLTYATEFDPTTAFMMYDETDAYEQKGLEIADFASTFLGRPYSRGSKGPTAFDCSGFTSYIFRQYGIKLNASSSAQYTQGSNVSLAETKPGDLIFFSGHRISKTQVGHVGLVVDVDDDGVVTFIHAATSSGIRYDVYPGEPYYDNRFIGVRRVLTEE